MSFLKLFEYVLAEMSKGEWKIDENDEGMVGLKFDSTSGRLSFHFGKASKPKAKIIKGPLIT